MLFTSYRPLIASNRLAAISGRSALAYTHQWRNTTELKPFTMASVDSTDDYMEAEDLGWRTYRHTTDDIAFQNEVVCPHKSHNVQRAK